MSWIHLLVLQQLQRVICFKEFQIHLPLIIHCQHIQTTRLDKLLNEIERNLKQNSISLLINDSLVTYRNLQEDSIKWKDFCVKIFTQGFVLELPNMPRYLELNLNRVFKSAINFPDLSKYHIMWCYTQKLLKVVICEWIFHKLF